MLRGLNRLDIDTRTYRLANPPRVRAALTNLSISLEATLETIDFLGASVADDPVALLNSPFKTDPNFPWRPGRFSDGSWAVFYSAIEPETAEAERAYWCRREIQPQPPQLQRFHYRELRCRVNGKGFDVRPKATEWPFLTGGDSAYPECQSLARDAIGAGGDVMLCPSARRPGGTTAPVFAAHVLSEPILAGVVVIEIDVSGEIKTARSHI